MIDMIQLETVYQGAEIDIRPEAVREYLSLVDEKEIVCFMRRNTMARKEYPGDTESFIRENIVIRKDYQDTSFTWKGGSGEYAVWFATDEAFTDAVCYHTKEPALRGKGFFVPGVRYFWRVEDSRTGEYSVTDSFAVKDRPIRYISTEGGDNIRDLGGWLTESGKRVRYGVLYGSVK